MYIFMDAAAATGSSFPTSFVAVYVIGFLAAVTIGSIAWYNSKRPVGWENKDRPDVVPKVEKSDSPGVGQSEE